MRRVNKRTARKLYNSGIALCIVPCKCKPSKEFRGLCNTDFTDLTFDERVAFFTYYCCDNSVGKYPAFYV